jgi:hypothetical protein
MLAALGAGAPELVAQLGDVIVTLMIVIPLSERVGSAQLSRQESPRPNRAATASSRLHKIECAGKFGSAVSSGSPVVVQEMEE